jgi:tRNA-binding protein
MFKTDRDFAMSQTISWDDFEKVDIRTGTVIAAEAFPQARKPAYKLVIDFGPKIGQKKSSAQITVHYTPETLVGRQVMAVVNFPPRQIGPFMSEVLTLGFADDKGDIVLAAVDKAVPDGARLM